MIRSTGYGITTSLLFYVGSLLLTGDWLRPLPFALALAVLMIEEFQPSFIAKVAFTVFLAGVLSFTGALTTLGLG